MSALNDLFESLRRRQGNWVQWGEACQQLQKQGESSLAIFEETGFTPSQQNQMVVAAQVYASLSAEVATKYATKGSDVLYELRLLPHDRRSAVAELITARELELREVKEIVKAVKAFAALVNLPHGFSDHPADAVAYYAYRSAKETSDVQTKTRLIARGLQYAHTTLARTTIENLLAHLVSEPDPLPPRLPLYRFESEESLPRLFPVVGTLPLATATLQQIPPTEYLPPFGSVHTSHGQWIAIPSYQVVKDCQDGVILRTDNETLTTIVQQQISSSFRDQPEQLLILLDRTQTDWTNEHYLAIDLDGQLSLQWLKEPSPQPICGRILLILRQKQYFDETASQSLWQLDD